MAHLTDKRGPLSEKERAAGWIDIKELGTPEKGNRVTFDDMVAGFGIRITAKGVKAFILDYRIAGRQRRYTIGKYPAWTLGAARGEAEELRKRIDRGEDPMGARREAREAPTVRELWEEYEEVHLPTLRASTQANYRASWKSYILPRLGMMKVAAVSHADVVGLHRSIKASPYAANRAIATLSNAMKMAVRWGWRADNPVTGTKRNPENRRQRFLSQTELVALGKTLEAHPNKTAAAAIRFLLLTGARRGEVLGATWDQFDTERGVWTKPAATTKQKREHRLPLSAAAKAVLALQAERQKGMDPKPVHVFPGAVEGQGLVELKRAWRAITKAAGFGGMAPKLKDGKPVLNAKGEPVMAWEPSVRLHDLRHSHASILASAGMSLPIIGALLGHTQPATTARYAHLFDEPLREAVEFVGRAAGGTTDKPKGEVKEFRRKGRRK